MLVCVGLSFVHFISLFKFVCGLHDFLGFLLEGSVVTRFSVLLIYVGRFCGRLYGCLSLAFLIVTRLFSGYLR